ncbi:60S ribosomal protein l12, partial [Phtheirospermum japonicum]
TVVPSAAALVIKALKEPERDRKKDEEHQAQRQYLARRCDRDRQGGYSRHVRVRRVHRGSEGSQGFAAGDPRWRCRDSTRLSLRLSVEFSFLFLIILLFNVFFNLRMVLKEKTRFFFFFLSFFFFDMR